MLAFNSPTPFKGAVGLFYDSIYSCTFYISFKCKLNNDIILEDVHVYQNPKSKKQKNKTKQNKTNQKTNKQTNKQKQKQKQKQTKQTKTNKNKQKTTKQKRN